MKIIKQFIILLTLSFCFMQTEQIHRSLLDSSIFHQNNHISLIVNESLLNTFFNNMGEIKGEGENSFIDYSWYLLEPRIEIEEGYASFYAKIRAQTDNFRVTRDVLGSVKVEYNIEENLLYVDVDKADVVLDVDILGKNVVLGHLDIAKHFTKSLKLKGPQATEDEIDFKLPTGEIRKMNVEVVSYNLQLIKDAIVISTSLGFSIKE